MDETAIYVAAKAHHENWLKDRRAQGWTHGLIHDGLNLKNPYLLEFDELPPKQRNQEVAGVKAIFQHLCIPFDAAIDKVRYAMMTMG